MRNQGEPVGDVVVYAVRGSAVRYKARMVTTVSIGAHMWAVIMPLAVGKRGTSEWHKLNSPKPMVVLDADLAPIAKTEAADPRSTAQAGDE